MAKKPTRKFISLSDGEKDYAMSRAVVQGDWCFVSGTVGYNYAKGELPESAAQQAQNTFTNICLLYTSPSPRDKRQSRMPSSA